MSFFWRRISCISIADDRVVSKAIHPRGVSGLTVSESCLDSDGRLVNCGLFFLLLLPLSIGLELAFTSL